MPRVYRILKKDQDGLPSVSCFRFGDGPFQQGAFAAGLTLEPDSPKHGNVAPEKEVGIAVYEADLAATRPSWQEDET